MGLERFDPALVTHDLVQDLKWDAELRAEFDADQAAVLDRYPLRPEERAAIDRSDFRALYDMGLHPYLGGQLARLMYGNAAGPDATRAVNRLVASLTGDERPDDRTTT
ncbi:MAG: extradiol ring-cleavage dioxygenase [Acidimicrobiales bacterium]